MEGELEGGCEPFAVEGDVRMCGAGRRGGEAGKQQAAYGDEMFHRFGN